MGDRTINVATYIAEKAILIDPETARTDEKFKEGVLFLIHILLIPMNFLRTEQDRKNRRLLYTICQKKGKINEQTVFYQFILPLLCSATIPGIPETSKAFGHAKDYGTKLLTLALEIQEKGEEGKEIEMDWQKRIDLERSLVLWLEWYVVCTCPEEHKAGLTGYIKNVAIPIMFSMELDHPLNQSYRKYREQYTFMLEEITGQTFSFWDVTVMYGQNQEAAHDTGRVYEFSLCD
jgi:hypothetical protein